MRNLVTMCLVLISVGSCLGSVELTNVYIPPCGTTQNVTGTAVGSATWDSYKVMTYIFISGSGWWVKPYSKFELEDINPDGSFSVDITTGGLDGLATIVFLAICDSDYVMPNSSRVDFTPENSSIHWSNKYYRDPSNCHRTIEWSGKTWYVKNSGIYESGPGPNKFDDESNNVWVDANGDLHLTIIYDNGKWESSEIISLDEFGFGTYEFDVIGNPILDMNAVLGLFTWKDDAVDENDFEIDVEQSQWGVADAENLQYVVQPWHVSGNRSRYYMVLDSEVSTHRFDWNEDIIYFQSFYDDAPWSNVANIIADWVYTGNDIPLQSENINVRLNLWLMNGNAPSDGQSQEVIIKEFRFFCDEQIPGDINQDCKVNMFDLSILADNWLER